MRIKLIKIVMVVSLAILLGACSQSKAIEAGDRAPDFSLADLDGKMIKLSEYAGKVVILDFFASWCPPCREEIPDFIELQKTYGVGSFSMIGVALVSYKDAKQFVEKTGINYPVIVDDGKISIDYGPIRSIPTTFVIGKDGKIAKYYIGYKSKDVFEADIKALIQ